MGSQSMADVVKKLKGHINKIARRADVRVATKEFGKKASKKLIQTNEGRLPSDLLEFYGLVNGLHFEWSFFPEPIELGCTRIPPLRADDGFVEDPAFGSSARVRLLDEMQPEGAAYLLQETGKDVDEAVVVFAVSGEEADHQVVASSVADYLELGARCGFGWYWQQESAEAKKIRRRLAKPPVKPDPVGEGARVVLKMNGLEMNRGRVLGIKKAKPDSSWSHGPVLALVELDDGYVAWVSKDLLKPQKKKDLYETFAVNPQGRFDELLAGTPAERAETLARIAAASTSTSTKYIRTWNWDGQDWNAQAGEAVFSCYAPRIAGLFGGLPFERRFQVGLQLLEDWLADPGQVGQRMEFKPDGSEYDKQDWDQGGYCIADLVSLVLAALSYSLFERASQDRFEAVTDVLPVDQVERLRRILAALDPGWKIDGRENWDAFLGSAFPGTCPELFAPPSSDARRRARDFGLGDEHGILDN